MKRCPTCKKTFTDQHLSFCTDDGTPLLSLDTPEDEATLVRPAKGDSETAAAGPSRPSTESEPRDVPPYQPPGSYIPPHYSGQSKRKTWPWIVGILALVFLLFAGLGIAAVILIPNMMRAANTNSRNLNANIQRNESNPNLNERNSNLSSDSADENRNSGDDVNAEDNTPPPTDQEAVLADLKNLEDEWTVANINADKKKLNRILADDYVGITDGRAQGKAEYLKTIERDTSIQRWEFDGLKVSLNGDRASLTGTLRLEVRDERGQNQNLAFRFTDKFVWRDGRWQATGSEVTPLKEGTPA